MIHTAFARRTTSFGIFAITDALDAMTHARPFQDAIAVSRALEVLRQESGRQFDPQIVEAALALPLERWTALLEPDQPSSASSRTAEPGTRVEVVKAT